MDAGLQLGEGLGELEIRRGVVNRVGRSEQDQRFDRAGIDVRLERGEIAEALGFGLHGEQRLAFADVAERDVDRKGEKVDGGGLARTGENQRLAGVFLEILDERR